MAFPERIQNRQYVTSFITIPKSLCCFLLIFITLLPLFM